MRWFSGPAGATDARGSARRRGMIAGAAWLATTLLLIAVALAYARFERRVAARDECASMESGLDDLQGRLLRHLDVVETMLDLVDWYELNRDPAGPAHDGALLRALTTLAHRPLLGILQVGMIGPDGEMAFSTGAPEGTHYSLADREHFRAVRDGAPGIFISLPLVGRSSGRLSIQYSRALRAADGTLRGVAVASVEPATLAEFARDNEMPARHFRGVARLSDGAIIAQNMRMDEIAKGETKLDPALIAQLHEPGTHDGGTVTPLSHRPAVVAWRQLPRLGVVIYAMRPMADLDEEIAARMRMPLLLFVLLGAVIAGAAVLAAYNHFSRQMARRQLRQLERQHQADQAARDRMETLIGGLPTALFSGSAQPDGSFTLEFQSRNLGAILRQPEGTEFTIAELPYLGDTEQPEVKAFYRQVLADGSNTVELTLPQADGSRAILLLRAQLERSGGRFEIIGQISDITREHLLATQIVHNEKMSMLGQMATSMAHELNQPLAVISFAAENAEMDLEQHEIGRANERLALIARQIDRARRIIDHLRIFGRNDDGAPGPTDLHDVLEGVGVLANGLLRRNHVELETNLPDALPQVMARQVPLEQVFMNLFQNSCDALEGNSEDRRISVSAEADAEWVMVHVVDNGQGIRTDQLDKIFDPFFTTKPVGRGTGLGLSVCHGIITGFGGTITAHPSPTGGAAFVIRLKRA